MKAIELIKGQNYKIGTEYYTYNGTVGNIDKLRKTTILNFWLREDGIDSPILN